MEQISKNYGDREILEDMLASQKEIAAHYNRQALDCAHHALKNELMTLLGEEHQMGMELFTEMEQRGWVVVEQASPGKIQQAKDRFSGTDS